MDRRFAATLAVLVTACRAAFGCTILIVSDGSRVVVGNNEDYRPGAVARAWFRPTGAGRIGYVTWGFEERFPEGGVNERGLFFDAAALPEPIPIRKDAGRPDFEGYLVEPVLSRCGTVAEALEFIGQYNLTWQEKAQILLVDRSGDYAVVHANFVLRKPGGASYALTNHDSRTPLGEARCWRRATANAGLATCSIPTVENATAILDATAQRDLGNATVYSQAVDLTDGTVTFYQLGDFGRPARLTIRDELARGRRDLEVKDLFPPTLEASAAKMGFDATVEQVAAGRDADPEELSRWGYDLLRGGREAEARRVFETARTLLPSARADSDLANLLAFGGDADRARPLYRNALDLDPGDASANRTLAVDGFVRFRIKGFDRAASVGVAGSFNGFKPEALPLERRGDAWEGKVRLAPGRYPYKLLVDGTWCTDPSNGLAEKPGEYWNSLLIVD